MNQVYIIGVVSFPKFGQTQQNKPKCTCKLGIARRKKNPQEQTQYDNITVTAYGDDASKLVDKARVMVQGSLNTYNFVDQGTGQEIKVVQVQASIVLNAPYPQQSAQPQPQQTQYSQPHTQRQAQPQRQSCPPTPPEFTQPNPGGQNNSQPWEGSGGY